MDASGADPGKEEEADRIAKESSRVCVCVWQRESARERERERERERRGAAATSN